MHTHWCNCEGFVQPADHFQHVQRQRYALYVPGELAKPCVHSPVGTFVHTGCLRRRRLSPPRPLDPSPALIHMPPPQGATKFNQPLSFDTSEVTSMSAMFYGGSGHVRIRPCPGTATPRAPHGRFTCAPWLSTRAGLGLQPAVELRHVEGHRHDKHVLRTLYPYSKPHAGAQPAPTRCASRPKLHPTSHKHAPRRHPCPPPTN